MKMNYKKYSIRWEIGYLKVSYGKNGKGKMVVKNERNRNNS